MQQPTYAVTGMDLSHRSRADLAVVRLGAGRTRPVRHAHRGRRGERRARPAGAGEQWQVVYHSEVAGTWAT